MTVPILNPLTDNLARGVMLPPFTLVDLNGNMLALGVDANNNLNTTQGSLLAGEDLTNNVMRTEEQGTYAIINSNTAGSVKAGSGFLYRVTIGDPGSAWVLTCYDATSATGTPFVIKAAYGTLNYTIKFNTGLWVVPSGTTAGNAVFSFR